MVHIIGKRNPGGANDGLTNSLNAFIPPIDNKLENNPTKRGIRILITNSLLILFFKISPIKYMNKKLFYSSKRLI